MWSRLQTFSATERTMRKGMEMDFIIRGCALCLLICMTSVSATSQATGSTSPKPFSGVFMACIREKNLPAVTFESDILTVMYTLSQSESMFNSFIDCMAAKRSTNRNSSDSTEWYLARAFDKDYTKMFWPVFQIFENRNAYDIGCLTNTGEIDKLEQCLANVTKDIQFVRSYNIGSQLDNMTDGSFVSYVCSELEQPTVSSPQECFRSIDTSSCAQPVQLFLSSYVMLISCNTSYQGVSPNPVSPTPHVSTETSPIIVDPSPVPHSPEVAFFSCMNLVYPGRNFSMLFPPSEISLTMVRDLDQAQAQHEIDIDGFCSNINRYTDCVSVKLKEPRSLMDSMLKQYMDVDNFGKTFRDFCSNKEMVKSNFKCAYRSTLADSSCDGGMNDVITYVMNTDAANAWALCSRFKKGRECRINRQLKPCDGNFSMVMDNLLKGVLNEKCRAGEIIFPENDMTDLLPCLASHMKGIIERGNPIFNNSAKEPNMYEIYNYYMGELSAMCRQKDSAFACMTRTLKTSTKRIDVMLTQMFSIENMIKILDYNCEMVPDLSAHGKCLVTNIGFTGNNFTDCVSIAAQTITNLNASSATAAKEQICEGMGSILQCYDIIMDGCDKNLILKFNELMRGVRESCNNPSYKLQFNSISGSSTLTTGPLAAASTILAMYSLL